MYQVTWSTLSWITWIQRVLKLVVLVHRKGSQTVISLLRGKNFVQSVDCHNKVMGCQNSTYPLAINSCINTASRKLLWLRTWVSNSNPWVIGRWYLEHLNETRTIASCQSMDRGTETGTLATVHAFLRRHHSDVDLLKTIFMAHQHQTK